MAPEIVFPPRGMVVIGVDPDAVPEGLPVHGLVGELLYVLAPDVVGWVGTDVRVVGVTVLPVSLLQPDRHD